MILFSPVLAVNPVYTEARCEGNDGKVAWHRIGWLRKACQQKMEENRK